MMMQMTKAIQTYTQESKISLNLCQHIFEIMYRELKGFPDGRNVEARHVRRRYEHGGGIEHGRIQIVH